ncbi:hypothetical protein GFC01_17260 [Desulfofundulus thermobenzoicus]|uniref:Uncharacterized protein n=1 Tax=Desulfofundulus thermobenzoicus TaxID=29376 RepID=A0A6N7IV65_9FIRM|nr:hypothetical protein [Desulfofundulus thermobenzoicus]MQL53974.1 hypothetical protein [Desulfofundulus thermobenzoicus]
MNQVMFIFNKRLCSERGSISIFLLGLFLTVVMVGLLVVAIMAAGIMKNAYKNYEDIDAAIKYAVFADNLNGAMTGVIRLDPDNAKRYFVTAYSIITNTAYGGDRFTGGSFPAPVVLKGFDVINAGDPLPDKLGGANGMAVQPGYLVTMDVPVFQGTILGMKVPPYYITMRRFANVGSVSVQS